MDELKRYVDKHVTPRLAQIRKEQALRYVVPMAHESEL